MHHAHNNSVYRLLDLEARDSDEDEDDGDEDGSGDDGTSAQTQVYSILTYSQ
jgi:hypothetical protein